MEAGIHYSQSVGCFIELWRVNLAGMIYKVTLTVPIGAKIT